MKWGEWGLQYLTSSQNELICTSPLCSTFTCCRSEVGRMDISTHLRRSIDSLQLTALYSQWRSRKNGPKMIHSTILFFFSSEEQIDTRKKYKKKWNLTCAPSLFSGEWTRSEKKRKGGPRRSTGAVLPPSAVTWAPRRSSSSFSDRPVTSRGPYTFHIDTGDRWTDRLRRSLIDYPYQVSIQCLHQSLAKRTSQQLLFFRQLLFFDTQFILSNYQSTSALWLLLEATLASPRFARSLDVLARGQSEMGDTQLTLADRALPIALTTRVVFRARHSALVELGACPAKYTVSGLLYHLNLPITERISRCASPMRWT